jgi:hypothetical protein
MTAQEMSIEGDILYIGNVAVPMNDLGGRNTGRMGGTGSTKDE